MFLLIPQNTDASDQMYIHRLQCTWKNTLQVPIICSLLFTGCYEVETSEHIALQVWKRLDEELPGADWRSVMRDLKLDVLIL